MPKGIAGSGTGSRATTKKKAPARASAAKNTMGKAASKRTATKRAPAATGRSRTTSK